MSLKLECLQIPTKLLVLDNYLIISIFSGAFLSLETTDVIAIERKEAVPATRGSKRLISKLMGLFCKKNSLLVLFVLFFNFKDLGMIKD